MKIAVVGCGAVGSYYGAMLCRAGQDVHFLVRSDFDVVRRDGVHVRSVQGDFHVRPAAARSSGDIGICDLVVIALKTTSNDQYSKLLPPLVGPRTALLTLQNGLGNEERLAELFSPEQILGGLCFVCLNRVAPGVIHHIAHGKIVLGEFQGPPRRRAAELADLFRQAGVACELTDNLARAHWEKLVWNIPFNGLGVAGTAGYEALTVSRPPTITVETIGPVLTTDRLLGEMRWEKLVRELMIEVIAAATHLGLPIAETEADEQIERTRVMGAYKASTLLDFENGRPLEFDSMFLEPLRRAENSRMPTPRLSALCSVLKQLDPGQAASMS